MLHDLKCTPEHFAEVRHGRKTAELRNNDRGFYVDDVLLLREWSGQQHDADATRRVPVEARGYHGAWCLVTVTHVLRVHPGLVDGYVVLSLSAPFQVHDA